MSDSTPISPLRDDEFVFRRLADVYFDRDQRVVKDLAFRPTKADTDGLSFSRQCVGPEGAAATGRKGKDFFVAVLRVGDVAKLGLTLKPDREDHAVITELTYAAVESKSQQVRDRVKVATKQLNSIVIGVDGPFPGQSDPPTSPLSPA